MKKTNPINVLFDPVKIGPVTTKNRHIKVIGDAIAPGLIADSIFSGHLAAENFETPEIEIEQAMFRREMPSLK